MKSYQESYGSCYQQHSHREYNHPLGLRVGREEPRTVTKDHQYDLNDVPWSWADEHENHWIDFLDRRDKYAIECSHMIHNAANRENRHRQQFGFADFTIADIHFLTILMRGFWVLDVTRLISAGLWRSSSSMGSERWPHRTSVWIFWSPNARCCLNTGYPSVCIVYHPSFILPL